jgi:DNA-binding transcriptional LysR family regulator
MKNCFLLIQSRLFLYSAGGIHAMASFLSISTDQVAAFVELARQGSLRQAAQVLHITEQGVRNRLLVLEQRLGVPLYRKRRGPRRLQPLTEQGQQFLPQAHAFLERARQLAEVFAGPAEPHEIHVAATQYLILYVLIDSVRRFHKAFPHIRVRLSNRRMKMDENG